MESWQRTVRILWLVQFLTTLAVNLGLTFVPFYLAEDPVLRVEDPERRILYTGLILAGPFATTILFTPFWGWVADRTGKKRQVVRACCGLGLTQLLMAIAQSPEQMIAIRMVQGMISGVLAASLGLVAVVTPIDRRGGAIALLQSATSAGHIFGPVLGGVLAAALGFRATYTILGTSILLAGVIAWLLLRQDGFTPSATANPFVALIRSGQSALAQPMLRQALLILVAGQFAFTVTQAVFAIFAGNVISAWTLDHEAAPAWWNSGVGFTAIAMTLTGLASVAGSIVWGRLHDRGKGWLTPCGAAILAVSFVLLFAVPDWRVILLARVGVGIGIAAMTMLQFADIAKKVAAEDCGQMMGFATALTHAGNLAGFVLGGVLATWWTEAGNFAFGAGIYAAIALFAIHGLRSRAQRSASCPRSTGSLAHPAHTRCAITHTPQARIGKNSLHAMSEACPR